MTLEQHLDRQLAAQVDVAALEIAPCHRARSRPEAGTGPRSRRRDQASRPIAASPAARVRRAARAGEREGRTGPEIEGCQQATSRRDRARGMPGSLSPPGQPDASCSGRPATVGHRRVIGQQLLGVSGWPASMPARYASRMRTTSASSSGARREAIAESTSVSCS